MKLTHIRSLIYIKDEHTEDEYIVIFYPNKIKGETGATGDVYKNKKFLKTLSHQGGLVNKTKAMTMIKQATGNYKW